MASSAGFQPRRFQTEFRALCSDVRDGSLFPVGASYPEQAAAYGLARVPPQIVLEVAAGAGKSTLPPILAAELLERRVDKVCWLVPRLTLQDQAERSFEDAALWGWLGSATSPSGRRYEIRQSTNELDPSRGKTGWVSTQQAVELDVQAALHEFSRSVRYALAVDEAHHVLLDGALHRNLRPLVERAELLVLMSGLFQRGDRQKIGLLRYRPDRDRKGRPVEVWDDRSDRAGGYAVVRYRVLDALREGAIKPLEFHYYDGKLGWSTSAGDRRDVGSFAEVDPDDLAAAIGTALRTEYAHEVLERAVDHWRGHRERNPRAKLLVVAKGIDLAKEYLSYLRRLGLGRVGIATTAAPEDAVEKIARFRRDHDDPFGLDGLVTVAMAYEGLNVPQITHVAALTHIRSTPWIYQMLSRANRMDYGRTDCAPRQQYGFVFAPRDPLFLRCAQTIRAQQDQYLYEQREAAGAGPRPTQPPLVFPSYGNTNGRGGVEDLGTTDAVADDRAHEYEQILRDHQLWGQVPVIVLDRAVAAAHGRPPSPATAPPSPRAAPAPPPPAPSPPPRPGSKVRETHLRRDIQELCKKLDGWERQRAGEDGEEPPSWGTWNKRVRIRYGKSRSAKSDEPMTEEELERVKGWLTGVWEEIRGEGGDVGVA